MKNFIKSILLIVILFFVVGTAGALEVGNISPLQCIVQGGIALAFLYIIFAFDGGEKHE